MKSHSNILVDNKKLITRNKSQEQKYLILLSNQQVIIGSEWLGMKMATRFGKPISDMLPTDARINDQVTTLDKLLDNMNYTAAL